MTDHTGMDANDMFGDTRPAHNCAMLERQNAHIIRADRSKTRKALFVVAIAFGMALAALAFSNAYARGIDALNNPHLEGFE